MSSRRSSSNSATAARSARKHALAGAASSTESEVRTAPVFELEGRKKETGYKLNGSYPLFPSGPAKGACKLAGLPKPTGCV
ncbi:MAG: TusE/DsrC/DsvC family sulfur relay protein [Terriglobales bacterium]